MKEYLKRNKGMIKMIILGLIWSILMALLISSLDPEGILRKIVHIIKTTE